MWFTSPKIYVIKSSKNYSAVTWNVIGCVL